MIICMSVRIFGRKTIILVIRGPNVSMSHLSTNYEAAVSFCLSVPPPPLFRHERRTATKFGTHIRVDMGLILS